MSLPLTPIRSSKSAKKPFRSPFAVTKNNEKASSPANTAASPCSKLGTEWTGPRKKRILGRTVQPVVEQPPNDSNAAGATDLPLDAEISQDDLEAVRKRIYEKQRTIDSIKTKVLYQKKNKAEDLMANIKIWREACQMALERLHKETQERQNSTVTMGNVLAALAIPESLVNFSQNEDTFEST